MEYDFSGEIKGWWFISDFLNIPLRGLSRRRLRYRQRRKGFGVRLLSWEPWRWTVCTTWMDSRTPIFIFPLVCWYISLCLVHGSLEYILFSPGGRTVGPIQGHWGMACSPAAHSPAFRCPSSPTAFSPTLLKRPQGRWESWEKFWKNPLHSEPMLKNASKFTSTIF